MPGRARRRTAGPPQSGKRASAGGRTIEPIHGAAQYRQYRMRDPSNPLRFVDYEELAGGPPKEIESATHRFQRKYQFAAPVVEARARQLAQEEEEADRNLQENDDEDVTIREREELNRRLTDQSGIVYNPKSSKDRNQCFSYMECFCFVELTTHPYTAYLRSVRDWTPDCDEEKPILMQPPEDIIDAYVHHLREDIPTDAEGNPLEGRVRGRRLKLNSILKALRCISGTMLECGGRNLVRGIRTRTALQQYKTEDVTDRAVAFDIEIVLPMLYQVLCASGWGAAFIVKIWARLLVQLALIARSTCVTDYCPTMEHVRFPENRRDWYDDQTPYFIEVGFLNWKGREANQVGNVYWVRIFSNPNDLTYCPVHWMLQDWSYRTEMAGADLPDDAPILSPMTSKTYRDKLGDLFRLLPEGEPARNCTSHSLRRSAAQWAARCCVDILDIKDIGRWKTLEHVALYVADGKSKRRLKMGDSEDNVDPIWRFWAFNCRAKVSSTTNTARHERGD